MAKELLAVLSNDNGATEMQNIINQLKLIMKKEHFFTI
jgi:hypothetical protein